MIQLFSNEVKIFFHACFTYAKGNQWVTSKYSILVGNNK